MNTRRIAIFGRSFNTGSQAVIESFFSILKENNFEVWLYSALLDNAYENGFTLPDNIQIFDHNFQAKGFDFLFSIGGDGTFLRSARMIGETGVPIVGINTGRLGFLADNPDDTIVETLTAILSGDYRLEERSLLQLNTDCHSFTGCNFALNDISILRRDTSSLIIIHVYIDGDFLNSYWADGLIISTPTGSTAYNMSAGGPIVLPQSKSIVITPIAPHSLTVRPLVIPEGSKITLRVESRSSNFLVSVDSQSTAFETNKELIITRAPHTVKIVKLKNHGFYETLRTKLMWGQDKRNT